MANLIRRIKEKFANKQATQESKAELNGNVWKKRIVAANLHFEKWEQKFKCKKLIEYYEGHQWPESDQYSPYVINMVLSTIQVKSPALLFKNPVYSLKPKPSKADFNFAEAQRSAQLKTDTLNYFAQDSVIGLGQAAKMCLLDSFFYFAVMEVGYSADWIDNPNAGKPILKSDYDEEADREDAEVIFEPAQLPEKEYIYVKRIPPNRFRIGGNDNTVLERNNWVGYFEYVRMEDLLAQGVNRDLLDNPAGMHRSSDFVEESQRNSSINGDLVKIWKIWDLRSKEKLVIKDATGDILFPPVKFKRLPIKSLKFIERTSGFLPIPVVFNWKGPQDEINEAHEMNRAHRRKARSLFQMLEQGADEDEIDKMLTAPDMSVIKTKVPDAIKPIQLPTVDASMGIALTLSKDDFMIVAGTSSEDTGQVDRQTATDAQLKHNKAQIRESAAQETVASFLCEIGNEILLQVKEKFTLPFWISVNADRPANPDEVAEIQETYKLISAEEDFGDEDCEVSISIESLSPVTNDIDKRKFLEFLTLIQQFPLLATNPDLIFELAAKCGYRNQKVIRQLVKVAQLGLMIQMSGLVNQAGGAGAGPQQGGVPQNPQQAGAAQGQQNMIQNRKSPEMEAIMNQLKGQVQ